MSKKLASLGILLVLLLLWMGSEVYYASSIKPRGVRTLAEHYQRFGDPIRIREFQHKGTNYYELMGHPPKVLAFPSSPPVYIYDESGRFIDWCADPGDSAEYYKRWPVAGGKPMDAAAFRKNRGL